jgi:hypothetical protein
MRSGRPGKNSMLRFLTAHKQDFQATPYTTQEQEMDLDQYVAASLCTR